MAQKVIGDELNDPLHIDFIPSIQYLTACADDLKAQQVSFQLHSHVGVGGGGEPLARQPDNVQPGRQLVEEPGVTCQSTKKQ